MSLKTFFESSDVKILFYLHGHNGVRYSILEKEVVKSRGALSVSLRELLNRKLITRVVETTKKPIQTTYFLTDKGTKLVQQLIAVQKLIL